MDIITRHIPVTLFTILAGKIIWQGNPTVTETVALLGLGVFSFVYQYYSNNAEIKALRDEVELFKDNTEFALEKVSNDVDGAISAISSVKVGVGMRARRTVNE